MSRSMKVISLLLVALGAGCGDSVPPPVAPGAPGASGSASGALVAEPAGEKLFALRTGTLEPVRHAGVLRGVVVGRSVDGDHELLRVRFAARSPLERTSGKWTVSLDGGGAPALAIMEDVRGDATSSKLPRASLQLWIRRPQSEAGKGLSGDAYRAHRGPDPGEHHRLEIGATASAPADPKLKRAWAEAFARHLRSRSNHGTSAWHAFAEGRVQSVFGPGGQDAAGGRGPRSSDRTSNELARLMETTTGATSIQAALQHDRRLFLDAAKRPRTIPMGKVRAVRLTQHPFPTMLRELGRPVPAEPLAEATPAEFYYLRFATLTALFTVMDQVDIWGTPGASVFSSRAEEYDVADRYLTALGVDRSEIARVLGPSVIGQVAVVGSDPYLREGSDVTVLFRVKSRPLFDGGLARALSRYEQRHGTLTRTTARHAGATITESRSADGQVAQLRTDSGDLTVLSNSPAAIRRVLDAIGGRRARLSDEPDFRFMLARDAGTGDDVLGYAGDRFVAEVVGARQKILEARRQIALAELQTPGYAALLYGWLNGRRPTSQQQLLASGLLRRQELTHHDGAAIDWEPGRVARSKWGTSRALTPLIDLPAPTRVSSDEQHAYERFARSYERRWSTYVDPFMLRLALEPREGQPERLVADLRVLPLLESRDVRDLIRLVGQARLLVPALGQGARLVAGIGKDARVRREVSDLRRTLPGGRELKLDWLGDWVMVGIEDRPEITRVAGTLDDDLPQVPLSQQQRRRLREEDALAILNELPLYAVIGIRSRLGAGVALTWARSTLVSAVPDVEWKKYAEHNGTSVVRIRYTEQCEQGRDSRCDMAVFYALTRGALVVSFREATLRRVLDELAARPVAVEADGPDGQFVAETVFEPGGGLWTTASWYLEMAALESQPSSRAVAETLLRGAPDLRAGPDAFRQLALATFGAVPVTPDGGIYQLSREGVLDPERGTEFAPVWPRIPVAGSPVEALLGSLRGLRWETSFDDEGQAPGGAQMRSLHVQATLALTGGS